MYVGKKYSTRRECVLAGFAGGDARVGTQVLFSKAVCGFGEKKKPPQSGGFFYTG